VPGLFCDRFDALLGVDSRALARSAQERGVCVSERISFPQLVGAVVVLMVILGVVLFVLLGATTNKGTTGAIQSEYSQIVRAEKMSCTERGRYAPIATLEKEGLLAFKPVYNSVVYLPGPGCGSYVVGSSAYQSAAS
jgi:hypothetical protein